MKLDENKIYYVYEWYNVDTGEIFYVGRGCGDRYRNRGESERNAQFIRYLKEHPNCESRKIAENLDEETACLLEDARIKALKDRQECTANIRNSTTRPGRMFGEANGFYGKHHSDATIKKLREINSNGRWAGENNPQYGISPKERMTEEQYSKWKQSLSVAMSGKNNPQYGIDVKTRMGTQEKYEAFCKSCSRGNCGDNPNAKPIRMWNDDIDLNFDCLKDCATWLFINKYTLSKNCYNNISTAIKNNKTFLGFNFKKL